MADDDKTPGEGRTSGLQRGRPSASTYDAAKYAAADAEPREAPEPEAERVFVEPGDIDTPRVLRGFETVGPDGARRYQAGEVIPSDHIKRFFMQGAYGRRQKHGYIGLPSQTV